MIPRDTGVCKHLLPPNYQTIFLRFVRSAYLAVCRASRRRLPYDVYWPKLASTANATYLAATSPATVSATRLPASPNRLPNTVYPDGASSHPEPGCLRATGEVPPLTYPPSVCMPPRHRRHGSPPIFGGVAAFAGHKRLCCPARR